MRAFTAFTVLLVLAGTAAGQGFDSTSDGSDGALSFPGPAGTIIWDPSTAGPGGTPLDADGNGIFHFTTIDIPSGMIVKLTATNFGGEGRAVTWLATGDVTIGGTLDLNGAQGHSTSGPALPSEPGAGGWSGGSNDGTFRQSGNGPGGGAAIPGFIGFSGAHRLQGGGDPAQVLAQPYGNRYQLPLVGGSGGAAGENLTTALGYGGGAGGGAILIASSTTITLTGAINARGGTGVGSSTARSGAGSGGAVRLVANTLVGPGTINVQGGLGFYAASSGYIRIQGFNNMMKTTTSFLPTSALSVASPGLLFPPTDLPTVKITSVDGVTAPLLPTGSFDPVDVVIDNPSVVTIQLEATQIPLGTSIQVRLASEDGVTQTLTSTALAGTLGTSTASATATFPSGHTRVTVSATWTP